MSTTETITLPVQPDIQYHPEYEKYKARTLRRKETEVLESTLPHGFPQKLESPLAWEGKDIEKRNDWIYHLSDSQLNEIDAALEHFKCMCLKMRVVALRDNTDATHSFKPPSWPYQPSHLSSTGTSLDTQGVI